MADENETSLPGVPMVRFRAPSGVVIDHTLPLHETIAHQWRDGELQRVNDDGELWEDGDEYDLSGAYGTDAGVRQGAGGEDEVPARPSDSAPKTAWQDYAVAAGACTEDEAAGMTRADLITRCTPPELDPLAPGA